MSKRPDLYTSYKTKLQFFQHHFKILVCITGCLFICNTFHSFKLLDITDYNFLIDCNSIMGVKHCFGIWGQVNLGHGVFVGIGTYVSSVLGGVATTSVIGYELDMVIWLPLSGLANFN